MDHLPPTLVDSIRTLDDIPPAPDFLERATRGIRLRGSDHTAAPAATQDPTAMLGSGRLAA